MSEYRHVLLATDFSEQSRRAATRAAAIVRLGGGALSVLHVVDYMPPGYLTDQLPAEFSSPTTLIAAARVYLAQWVTDVGLETANEWVETGSAKSEIVRMAKAHQVDLVVMGTSGAGAMRFLTGSTTAGVLHDAPCDVLAVRGTEAA